MIDDMDKDLLKEFNSHELSELERFLDALARQEEYASGMHFISGGYAYAMVDDIDWEAGDEDEDLLLGIVEWGEQDMGSGYSQCSRVRFQLSRNVLLEKITMREKLGKVDWE